MANMDLSSKCISLFSGKILLFAEVKQILSAVQLVIDTHKIKTKKSQNVSVTVEFSTSEITVNVGPEIVKFHLDHIQLTPASCNGLICLPNGELQLRMHVSGPNIGCQVNTKQKFYHQQQLVEKVAKEYQDCRCAMCGEKLFVDHCKFARVLPLPSENWNEMADTWFCHCHDDGTTKPVPNTLLPRQSDCLVGELYVLLHKSSVNENKYFVNKDNLIQCQRCHNIIGELFQGQSSTKDEKTVHQDTFKLHFHSVSFGSENSHRKEMGLSRFESLILKEEDFIARYFLEQCRVFTSYRFMVQPQVKDQKQCHLSCLLWLLDGDALMYHQEVKVRSKVTEVKQTTSVKVLYKAYFQQQNCIASPSSTTESLRTSWRKDKSVHDIELSYSLYITFLTALLRNTRKLPSSLRYLNGFHVGYLHKLSADIT